MKTNNLIYTILLVLATVLYALPATAQEKKVAATSPALYKEIASADSILFAAFNTQNMAVFQSMFTEDLEWFQDNGGLLSYKTVFENFDNNFKKEFKLSRELVAGSLEVHPVKDYGAIEIGTHQFRHMENGREETGTFKFVMIWKKAGGLWKISRVISYDH